MNPNACPPYQGHPGMVPTAGRMPGPYGAPPNYSLPSSAGPYVPSGQTAPSYPSAAYAAGVPNQMSYGGPVSAPPTYGYRSPGPMNAAAYCPPAHPGNVYQKYGDVPPHYQQMVPPMYTQYGMPSSAPYSMPSDLYQQPAESNSAEQNKDDVGSRNARVLEEYEKCEGCLKKVADKLRLPYRQVQATVRRHRDKLKKANVALPEVYQTHGIGRPRRLTPEEEKKVFETYMEHKADSSLLMENLVQICNEAVQVPFGRLTLRRIILEHSGFSSLSEMRMNEAAEHVPTSTKASPELAGKVEVAQAEKQLASAEAQRKGKERVSPSSQQSKKRSIELVEKRADGVADATAAVDVTKKARHEEPVHSKSTGPVSLTMLQMDD